MEASWNILDKQYRVNTSSVIAITMSILKDKIMEWLFVVLQEENKGTLIFWIPH